MFLYLSNDLVKSSTAPEEPVNKSLDMFEDMLKGCAPSEEDKSEKKVEKSLYLALGEK